MTYSLISRDRLEVRAAFAQQSNSELFSRADKMQRLWKNPDGSLMGDDIWTFDWMSIDDLYMAEFTRAVLLRRATLS